jgi:acetyltransferase-like isoleucine patch superfamily enzyme
MTLARVSRRANGFAARFGLAMRGARVSPLTRLVVSQRGRFLPTRGVVVHRHGSIFVDEDGVLEIGARAIIMQGAEIVVLKGATLRIGPDVYVGAYCNIRCAGAIDVGANARLAQFVSLIDANYAIPPRGVAFGELIPTRLTVGPGAWIGCQCTVLPGVSIGEGAIVGAGAVVTHDVAPNSIVAGNPAHVIGHRQ